MKLTITLAPPPRSTSGGGYACSPFGEHRVLAAYPAVLGDSGSMPMTKMAMVWTAAASMLHPETAPTKTVTRSEIDATVWKLFEASITPVMIECHLVSSEDRMADKNQPQRGGSRNRYLFRTSDGALPSDEGQFRLYKKIDAKYDGWDKTGPMHPDASVIPTKYTHLVEWYIAEYANSI